jgi:hypothetical protein
VSFLDIGSASHAASAAEKTTPLDHIAPKETGLPPPPPPPPPPPAKALSGLPSVLRARLSKPTSASTHAASEDSGDALEQPASSSVASESAGSVDAAHSASPVEAAHKDDISPDQIQKAFENGGLLIRTVKDENAVDEFKHTNVSIDQAKENLESGVTTHSGLRKWSLAHAEVKPNYFMMGNNRPLQRTLGVLAMPDKVGNHVVGVHERDNFSGGIKDDMKNLSPDDAKTQMSKALNSIKDEQKQRPGKQLDNSEIQTVGIPSNSVAGLMYRPRTGPATADDWKAAKSKVESRLSGAGPEFHGRTLPVFTYAEDGDKTTLTHLGSVHIPAPQS